MNKIKNWDMFINEDYMSTTFTNIASLKNNNNSVFEVISNIDKVLNVISNYDIDTYEALVVLNKIKGYNFDTLKEEYDSLVSNREISNIDNFTIDIIELYLNA